jgi:glycosyltransferase involved in cell wall biosynthesis
MVQLGADPQKIRLVCFGVDTEEFRPDKKDNRLRERLGIFDSPMIISMRRLEPVYDVATFVKSIPLVLAEFPDAKFVIGSNGSQREYLVQLAKSLGVFASVRFVGYVPSEELPVYLASSDLYVSTSLSDAGLAASTAEAMSCGLPVVVTDFGDNRLWVQDGANGFTVPVNDHESLASKIVFILKHKDVKERFGRRNRQIVQERNNWAKEMEKMQDLYKELICECGR